MGFPSGCHMRLYSYYPHYSHHLGDHTWQTQEGQGDPGHIQYYALPPCLLSGAPMVHTIVTATMSPLPPVPLPHALWPPSRPVRVNARHCSHVKCPNHVFSTNETSL
jgi:hypothetical protein